MSAKRKIPFGLRDGRLLQPDEVARGLACNCVCPGCGSRLVAHHGEKKVKHFVHHEAACANGYESAIHKAAKQVLLESKQILVPSINATEFLFDRETGIDVRETQSIAQRYISIEAVEVEKNLNGVVPDLVVSSLGKQLFVEIAFTHFVDEKKKSRLQQLGIATLEIDLSGLSELPSMSELSRLVVAEGRNRLWVFNPKELELQRRARQMAKARLAEKIAEKRLEREKHQRWVEQYIKMSEDEKLTIHLKQLGIGKIWLPEYIGVAVRGERSFSVRSVVWQAGVYAHFIYKKEFASFNAQQVCDWCYQMFRIKPSFPNAEKIAIWDYLKKLESVGILFHQGRQEFTVMSCRLSNLT
jgi:hypothetical protein